MKITLLSLLICISGIFASNVNSQIARVTIHTTRAETREIISEIEKQTDYLFVYNHEKVDLSKKLSLHASDVSVAEVLMKLFEQTDIVYAMEGDNILLMQKQENFDQQQSTKRITGTVTDSYGEPVIGANIIEKGTTHGTITDLDGNYSLNVTENAVLQISYIGYLSKEVRVGNQSTIHIQLQEDTQALDEIVVVGYGIQKKANLTGSVTVINSEKLENRPITNATQTLQGVQGVYVNQAGGQPGADAATIRIRGVGSIGEAGKLNPMVLVDGVEYSLSDINPNDIESISVLKDAASTAIYGSRAANGVILVTTKLGSQERISVDYSNYFGFQRATYLPDPVDSSVDFMEWYNKAMINQGGEAYYSDELINEFRTNPTSLVYPNTNWMDVMFGNAFIQEHNLRFSGGTQKTRYNLSGGYLDQDGVLKGMSGAKRYSFNVRVNTQITNRLNIEGSAIATRWDIDNATQGMSTAMNRIMRMVPIQPVGKMENGNWPDSWVLTPGQNSFQNPLIWAEEGYRKERTDRIMLNFNANLKLIDGLTYDFRASANIKKYDRKDWFPEVMMYDVKTGDPKREWSAASTLIRRFENDERITTTHLLNYTKVFKQDHDLQALLGASVETYKGEWAQSSISGFPTTDLQELSIGTSNQAVTGTSYKDALLSYFGRVQYAYKSKYLFEVNGRYDGSSRFAKGNRWGFFPSFSLGWRISEEDFMSHMEWLDGLKIKASWGQIGNQEIGRFQYVNSIALGMGYPFGGTYQGGSAATQYKDPTLSWETTNMTNIGLDWTIFKGIFSGEFEFFKKRTDGILRTVTLPTQVGALNGPVKNLATVDNTGFELSVSHTYKIGKDFSYQVGINATYVKNKVVDLQGETIIDTNFITKEGYPISSWYVYETDGLFQTQEEVDSYPTISNRVGPGDVKYVDRNKDGVIDGDDRYIAGNTFPDWMYGFNVGFSYKGFSLTTIWQGVANLYILLQGNMATPFNNGAGITKEWLTDSWTPENRNARLPRVTTYHQYTAENFSPSDFWLQDASYLRLKNIQLSYDFNKIPFLTNLGINRLRLFVNGQNLLTFTDMKIYDPEQNVSVTNLNKYPSVKTFTGGLNISF